MRPRPRHYAVANAPSPEDIVPVPLWSLLLRGSSVSTAHHDGAAGTGWPVSPRWENRLLFSQEQLRGARSELKTHISGYMRVFRKHSIQIHV